MNASKRLRLLEERLNVIRNAENCTVTVTFTDGATVKVPFYGGLVGQFTEDGELVETEIERRGWAGEVAKMECDRWEYESMVAIMAAVWNPVDK